MPAGFADSPRKRTVRELWNTPLLKTVHNALGSQYFYCGLPGRDILDIRLWKDMIRRIIAFEVENPARDNPREDVVALSRNLSLIGIPHKVYCGHMETTVLLGRDDDGEPFEQDELITLYNLDFCNAITGRIETSEGRRCLRFEALRHLLSLQRARFLESGESRFILLLTIRDEFRAREMQSFIDDCEKPQAVADFLSGLPTLPQLAEGRMHSSTLHLKAFVFTTLRAYCRGHNVASLFLPPVRYVGRTSRSPMVHFTVLCRFRPVDNALPQEVQEAGDFLARASLRATDTELRIEPCGAVETDASQFDDAASAVAFLQN